MKKEQQRAVVEIMREGATYLSGWSAENWQMRRNQPWEEEEGKSHRAEDAVCARA